MNKDKKQNKSKKAPPHPPFKPEHPNTKGAPNNQDREAQYEDKDNS